MKKIVTLLMTVFIGHSLFCQVDTEPALTSADQEIKIIYDATLGSSSLEGASKVYMHAGVILDSESGTSWQKVVGNWGEDDGIGEMTMIAGETDKWEITISPRTYFDVPSNPIYRIGMVFRNADGSKEGKSDSNSDIFIDLLQTGYGIKLSNPTQSSFLINQGESFKIEVNASENSTFTLTINNQEIETVNDVSSYSYNHTPTETTGEIPVIISGTNGTDNDEVSFSYIIRSTVQELPLPSGIKKGINYHTDETKVTLCLEAPLKETVYVLGDFNNWTIDPAFLMNKDGELFWLVIDNLVPNQEYAFQYMVDETIFIADPYSDKIVDPDDSQIPSSIYPNLIEYPTEAYRSKWYYQRASVIETDQENYTWKVADFEAPDEDELVIYELLIRDFFDANNRSYKSLLDTLSYLDGLGVNAIELMPITEFNGNNSWGYNNSFMFAPDKAYGSKNDLKAFIDEAHKLGIAVIIDIVMNHHDIPAPNAIMYFDGSKITSDNPWFNVAAPHGVLGFFFDFNHESSYTKSYMDSVNHYWMSEYKIDGFRFDLSKGFTQKQTTGFGDWGAYDASRISILKRMADEIWKVNSNEYIILEHFADNSEEKELSDYGMMLWGNMTHQYGQLTMGYSSESNISGVSSSQRNWNDHHLVGYMESHDEERLMVKCKEYGNENANYSTRNDNTALERIMATSAFFYTIPGPKMLWQFGEMGFDLSINRCPDGSIDDGCRVSEKPPTWEYLENATKRNLKEVTASLIKLKTDYSLFQSGEVTFVGGNNLSRYIRITQNDLDNPTDPSEMNALVVGNFDLTKKSQDVTFPHDGKWYHYFDQGDSVEIAGTTTFSLHPGEFRIYTDVKLPATQTELISTLKPLAPVELKGVDSEEGIVLSWVDKSSINTGYNIYRKQASSDWTLIDTVNDLETFTDDSVSKNQEYFYRIAAFNDVGERFSTEIEISASRIVLGNNSYTEIIFPNPAKEVIHLSTNKRYHSFKIINLSGKTIKMGNFSDSIEVGDLKSGYYILLLDNFIKFKFIKE